MQPMRDKQDPIEFRLPNRITGTATEWLRQWSAQYPATYSEHDYQNFIKSGGKLTAGQFLAIGRWKDRATSSNKWRPNVPSVAVAVWKRSAHELLGPKFDEKNAETFLAQWSEKKFGGKFKNGQRYEKRFGLSRATTLLHFITSGSFPIFDSRVRRAVTRLGFPISNTVDAYLKSYVKSFRRIALECGTRDFRAVDKALFCFGGKKGFD